MFYTTVWNSDQILKFYADGSFEGSYTITGASGLRDLAWDGMYLYGGNAGNMIYVIEPDDMTVIVQINSPEGVRAIAYDNQNDGFWVANWTTDFFLVGRDGSTINVVANPGIESNYGLAYDDVTGAPSLWVFSQAYGGGADLVQLDIGSGQLTGVTRDVLADIPASGTPIAGGAFLTKDYEEGIITLGGLIQADFNLVFGYEIGTYDMWISLPVTSGYVAPMSFQEIEVNFSSVGFDPGTYEADITFFSSPEVGTEVVHVTLDIIVGLDDLTSGLIKMYPNPATDFVNVELIDGMKEIQVLNYMGQVVHQENVVDMKKVQINTQRFSAGSYTVHFIATNNEITVKKLIVTR